MFLSAHAKHVHLLVRGPGLADTMSRYLISRIEACSDITFRPYTEIEALEGGDHLERIRWRNTRTGDTETREVQHLFLMTGASPNTGWLQGCLALDAKQFIKTGSQLNGDWPLTRAPHMLETSRPGVFAVGDIRSGSIKRVASAVGEGSMAVQFVHQVLAESSLPSLEINQPAFVVETAAISSQLSVAADHPVARNHDRDGIGTVR